MMSVNVMMMAIRPGMVKVAVLRSGLYQGRTRRSMGSSRTRQPACLARVRIDMPLATPPAIDIACIDVVVSDALTIRKACAGWLRWRSLPKSRSITSATLALPASISRRSSSMDDTPPTTEKYSLAVSLATSSRLSYERLSSSTIVRMCFTS